ncbi:MAG: T9SS type A sorting domain-containing protein, partial [Rhodothermales bacterium]|nr:T9SS type A sorting domain-containing protein [Rhodothermales bacterium]
PYLMTAQPVPGVIQAEHYDLGGEGTAYHDVDATNSGSGNGIAYRSDEAVDINYVLGAQQGYYVSEFEEGEWLEYQVTVPVSGAFNVDLRTASTAGGMASIHVDGTEVAGKLAIPVSAEFSTTRASNITLEEGIHTLRVHADLGSFDLDYITVLAYVEPPPAGTVLVDDFSDPTGAAWSYFGTASGEVTTGNGVNPFMRATFSGAGGSGGGFYGVMWNNLEDTQQAVLPADPWFGIRVRHSSTGTTVDEYTLEITVREDTDGNGWTTGQEDSHRFDTRFDSSSFNDEWLQISAPLTAFTNLGTGGNGILELAIDEVVLVVSQVVGADPSSVVVDFDDISISTGGVGTGAETVVPSSIELYKPYPNPSTGTVHVAYELQTSGMARFEVFDLLGRRVQPPVEAVHAAGRHWLDLDLSTVSQGVYFIRLEVNGAIKTQRLVLAR